VGGEAGTGSDVGGGGLGRKKDCSRHRGSSVIGKTTLKVAQREGCGKGFRLGQGYGSKERERLSMSKPEEM